MLPVGLAIDAAGDIYIADDTANIVYAVYSIISNGTNIYPVIGTGTAGYTGDDGPSIDATINAPLGIALDGSSDLFVVDSGNNVAARGLLPGHQHHRASATCSSALHPRPMLQYLANAGNANLTFHLPFTTTDSHYAVLASPTTCTANSGSRGGGCATSDTPSTPR